MMAEVTTWWAAKQMGSPEKPEDCQVKEGQQSFFFSNFPTPLLQINTLQTGRHLVQKAAGRVHIKQGRFSPVFPVFSCTGLKKTLYFLVFFIIFLGPL
jgi:hypothetical protein